MVSAFNGIMNVREDAVKIEGKSWEDDELRLLAAKKILQFRKMVDYWEPLLNRGRRYENYFNGNILTGMQRETYEDHGYIVTEPPIMKAPIRALVGQVLKSRKSGQVTTERNTAADAEGSEAEIETLNIVMKDMENKTREEYRIKEAISSAFISCYWNVLMYERVSPARSGDGVRYRMTHLPWSSCVFGPQTIREPDGSDIKEMFYFDYRTVADLIGNYPEMEKQITDHFKVGENNDLGRLTSVSQWEAGLTADERNIMYDVRTAADVDRSAGGLVQVVMHLFPVIRRDDVWVNIFDDTGETFEMRPPEWDDERWDAWVRENSQTYAGPVERETVTLWMTVFTMSGLVLFNGPHWFQENGALPCSFWLGAVDGNMPTGPAADIADCVLSACVGGIEQLHDLRTQSGRFSLVKEGAIKEPENLSKEMSAPNGAMFVSKDFNAPLQEAMHEFVRRPNTDWGEFREQETRRMYEISRVNEAMMGQSAPRQSAVAKDMEIAQALTVNATFVDNINRSWEWHQNLKLKMIAYLYTEWELIEARDDDSGQMMQVEVNAPAEYDAEGNAVSVINKLDSHRYRWIISSVDNSASAKARHNEEALTVINAAAGPLSGADPSGGLLAEFMMTSENPVLQRYGKSLAQKSQQAQQAMSQAEQEKMEIDKIAKLARAKADLLRAQKHGVMMNFAGEDLQNYPAMYQLYIQLQDIFAKKADEELNEAQNLAAPMQAQTEMGQ
jgi:hypothetical protein